LTQPFLLIRMSQVVLVSWEGTRVRIPAEGSEKSKFIKNCPDLNDEIRLKELEIDTDTLRMIGEFLSITESLPELAGPVTAEGNVIKDNQVFDRFFEGVSVEELHLLVLAAYKLDFKDLQRICSYKIAVMFAEIPKSEIYQELSVDELTVDEEDYMKFVWTKKLNYGK